MAWEKTALDLAERVGIDVPRRTITRINGRAVLLLDRFDRRGEERIGYLGAMTLVQGRDGGGSGTHDYVELAAELADVSAATDDDLSALWRRVAFSVAIHNTDDHFRNHGFPREGSGWRLVRATHEIAALHPETRDWTARRRARTQGPKGRRPPRGPARRRGGPIPKGWESSP